MRLSLPVLALVLLACADDEASPQVAPASGAGAGGAAAGQGGQAGQPGQAGAAGSMSGTSGQPGAGQGGQAGQPGQAGAGAGQGAGQAGEAGQAGQAGEAGQGGAGQAGQAGQGAGGGGPGGGGSGGGGAGGAGEAGAGGQGGASDEGSLVEDYCEPLAKLLCERGAGCGCGALLPGGVIDGPGCVEAQTARCAGAYKFLADAVTQGAASVSRSRASACIASLAASAQGCERLRPALQDAGCDPWFGGNEAIGEPCAFPLCAGGLGVCRQGVCGALLAEGEPCEQPFCAPGLICVDAQCKKPAGPGSPCFDVAPCAAGLQCASESCSVPLAPGQACTLTEQCAFGLACVGGVCGEEVGPCVAAASCGQGEFCAASRSCGAPSPTGSPCVVSEDCAAGLYCSSGECVAAAGEGLPCDAGLYCAAGLACAEALGTCQKVPKAGEPCALGLLGAFVCEGDLGCSFCGEGSGCSGTVCGPLPGENQTCTLDNRCAPSNAQGEPLGCDFTAAGSLCHVRRGEGQPCQNDVICQEGLFCDGQSGTCAPVRPAGAPCSAGNECGKGGTCQPSSSSTFACAPLPADGEYCLFDCAAGLRCKEHPAKAACLAGICSQL